MIYMVNEVELINIPDQYLERISDIACKYPMIGKIKCNFNEHSDDYFSFVIRSESGGTKGMMGCVLDYIYDPEFEISLKLHLKID